MNQSAQANSRDRGAIRTAAILNIGRAFPLQQVTATLVCAGLRRDEFLALGPLPGELPWGLEPISTGRWTGIPLREICSHFRNVGPSINKDNLLRWKRNGYRQWLKDEVRREDSHAKIRFLLGLVQEKKNHKILRATQQIAALQVADILTTLDHRSLRKSIQDDPAQYTRLLNALPRLAEAGLACERLLAETAASRKSKPDESDCLSPETLRSIEKQVGLL